VLRLAPDADAFGPSGDDLLALADAVREAARPAPPVDDDGPAQRLSAGARDDGRPGREVGRRGHLRALPAPDA
jgi:hypothetical protein